MTTVLKQLASGSPKKIAVMSVVEGSKNRRYAVIIFNSITSKLAFDPNQYCYFKQFLTYHIRNIFFLFLFFRQMLWATADPPHIVVGNPRALQRLVDMGKLRLNAVDMVVLDEVDACIIEPTTKRVSVDFKLLFSFEVY